MIEYDSYTNQPISMGACKKCCVEDELDAEGICGSCKPLDAETVKFLASLFKKPKNEEEK